VGSETAGASGASDEKLARGVLAVAVCFAVVKLLTHLLTNNAYGHFRDELYYIACGEHLDWGYVDHAPMVGVAAWFARRVLGDSLGALRFLPALAGALKVLLTGLLVREFGGGRVACAAACLCVLVAPIYLGIDTLFSMNAFEPVFWMTGALAVVLAVRRGEPRWWLLFGLAAGLGLQNKHSTLFYGFALFVGIVATSARRSLGSKWFWMGGALAVVIFLPNLWWEYRHDWATLELLSNVGRSGKNVAVSPAEFVKQQVLMLHPLSFPVWAAGLWFLLFDREGRRFRLLGVAYLVLLATMIALKGKNYYMQPVYPMLFAAGGVMFERLTRRPRAAWLKYAYPLVLLVSGAALAPLVLPLLPVESYLSFQDRLGFKPPKTEVGHAGPLPQLFGDMFGWPEMVDEVARVYNSLPAEERAKAGIFANNYGEAGAVDFYGPARGLPKAVSPHQNYFLWGPREYTGEVLILLQSKRKDAERNCASVEEAGRVGHPYAMAEEHFTIFVCRGLKRPLAELWPQLKHWN